MNQFRFDMHERQFPFVIIAIIAGIVGALMVVVAVKFTGFGPALVGQTYTQPVPQPEQPPVVIEQQPPTKINSLSLNRV